MRKLPRGISVAAQIIGILGILIMCYGIFRFVAGPRGEGEGDDAAIGRMMHAVGAFAVGGAMSFNACICVYVERLMATQHGDGS